jgi:hypothetical protein
MQRLNISFPQETRQRLKLLARLHGGNISEAARVAIAEEWRRQQPEGLEEAIATLRRRLELTRAQGVGTYAERQEVFKAIDALQEQAEIYLCEAPDYPEALTAERRGE